MELDYKKINKLALDYKDEMFRFLRELISIPSESGKEKNVVLRIKEEMEKVGFDKVVIDPLGNVFGYIGTGKHVIAMDAHIDTVGVGNIDNWKFDPYEGFEDAELIGGRGASDQKSGMAAMVYAGKIIKDLNLVDDYTLVVVGSIQEEDCEGLNWQYIIEKDNLKPEFVVITEPSSCTICRGQRGRMEIKVTTTGISCHGSAPERGDNAIFKMAPILIELKALNENLKDDSFLGKGSLAVSQIYFTSPSRCAVADKCWISIDRRLTDGETPEIAVQQIKNLPGVKAASAVVEIYKYEEPSYTGLAYPTESFFPTWVIDEDELGCQTFIEVYKKLFNEKPIVDKWVFSTNGVSIMGRYGIPCIGFGAGHEDQAHASNEVTYKSELLKAVAMYSAIPMLYVKKLNNI